MERLTWDLHENDRINLRSMKDKNTTLIIEFSWDSVINLLIRRVQNFQVVELNFKGIFLDLC